MTANPTVLVVAPTIGDADLTRVGEFVPNVRLVRAENYITHGIDEALEIHPEAEILVSWALPEEATGALRWVQLLGSGADHERSRRSWEQGELTITTGTGTNAPAMAQYCMAMVLYWAQQLDRLANFRQVRDWEARDNWFGTGLDGQVLGIAGYGAVGQRLAELATPFGMRILALERDAHTPSRERFGVPIATPQSALPIERTSNIDDIFRVSDYVVNALPLTATTKGAIDHVRLTTMKASAVLISVSRGAVIDESALAAVLRGGRLRGASLDVYREEPLPRLSPLFDLPNILLTPHVSGLHSMMSRYSCDLLIENLGRYLSNRPLLNMVDRNAGY